MTTIVSVADRRKLNDPLEIANNLDCAITQHRGLTAALKLLADNIEGNHMLTDAFGAIGEAYDNVARALDYVKADLHGLSRPAKAEA
jgi:hypothetical protein